MRILTVDVGTGTQDLYLYNSRLDMENNFKLVVPSPTMIIRQQIRQATLRKEAILLIGVTMGGGPCAWAAEDHLHAGLTVYATPEAARTFNDDLARISEMGIIVLSEDEARALPDTVIRLGLKDFDFVAITQAFNQFGVSLAGLAAIGVGVFDHGNAPPDISDRKFRFDYLDGRIRQFNRLSAFAYRAEDIPASMTRLLCVADSAREVDCPLVVMDTAPAAVLGATFDPQVAKRERVTISNIGNFHTLAFRLGKGGIEGLFEHHTGFLDRGKLEHLLRALADGTLWGEEVFNDQGHGALIYDPSPFVFGEPGFDVVVTGPRRNLFPVDNSAHDPPHLRPYYPAPFGDMMITGCFGILAAVADVMPELSEPIRTSLLPGRGVGAAPWEVD
jgi:uncharacterized protein (DUF1786 family)